MTTALTSARVVGTGSIGSRYLRVLGDLLPEHPRAVSLRGTTLRDDAPPGVAWEEPGDPDRPLVDLTVIASRTGRHVSDALDQLSTTRALLIEKPVAPTADAARTLTDAAAGMPIAVAAPLRFMDGLTAARDLLPDVGRIQGAEVRCLSWLPDWRPGTDYRSSYSADPDEGGVLRDLVHEIDYALFLLGAPRTVAARLDHSPDLGIPAETGARMRWSYADFDLMMDLDFAHRDPVRGLRITGERGVLTWDVLEAAVTLVDPAGDTLAIRSFPADLDRDAVLARQILSAPLVGQDERVPSLADGIAAVAICDLARQSDAGAGAALPLAEGWST